MPDDPRWSWCNNRNKCNALESSENHPPTHPSGPWKDYLPGNESLVPKSLETGSKGLGKFSLLLVKASGEHVYPDIQLTIWCSSLSLLLYIQHIHFCQVDLENGLQSTSPSSRVWRCPHLDSWGNIWNISHCHQRHDNAPNQSGHVCVSRPLIASQSAKSSNFRPTPRILRTWPHTTSGSRLLPISTKCAPCFSHREPASDVGIEHADFLWVHVGSFAQNALAVLPAWLQCHLAAYFLTAPDSLSIHCPPACSLYLSTTLISAWC